MDNFTIEGNGEELVFTLSNGQKFSFPSYMFSGIVDAIMQGSDMQYASQCAAWHKAVKATASNWRAV